MQINTTPPTAAPPPSTALFRYECPHGTQCRRCGNHPSSVVSTPSPTSIRTIDVSNQIDHGSSQPPISLVTPLPEFIREIDVSKPIKLRLRPPPLPLIPASHHANISTLISTLTLLIPPLLLTNPTFLTRLGGYYTIFGIFSLLYTITRPGFFPNFTANIKGIGRVMYHPRRLLFAFSIMAPAVEECGFRFTSGAWCDIVEGAAVAVVGDYVLSRFCEIMGHERMREMRFGVYRGLNGDENKRWSGEEEEEEGWSENGERMEFENSDTSDSSFDSDLSVDPVRTENDVESGASELGERYLLDGEYENSDNDDDDYCPDSDEEGSDEELLRGLVTM